MKNKLKKVIAYVLSFMMLFTMSAMNIGSVSAASTGSITVHTGKHDVNGVNFNAYRLMDATVSGNKVSYSISSNFTGFFTEELLNGTTGDDIDIKAYNYIKANVSTTDFQNKLKTYMVQQQEQQLEKNILLMDWHMDTMQLFLLVKDILLLLQQ